MSSGIYATLGSFFRLSEEAQRVDVESIFFKFKVGPHVDPYGSPRGDD
jgi:hypothetical protein